MNDSTARPTGQKVVIAIAMVMAIAAVVIEVLVLLDRAPSSLANIGGGLIILAIAVSVVGRGLGRTKR